MAEKYYYLISTLPILHFDQPDELDIGRYLEHIEDNLCPRDRACTRFLREWIDLTNLQGALMGHADFLPYGCFSRDQLLLESEDAVRIPLLWQDYVRAFHTGDHAPIERLWIDYFGRGTGFENRLVRYWSESESILRGALAVLRAQRLGRPLDDLEAMEHDELQEMIAGSRLPDLGMAHRFPWMTTLRDALERQNPLETERVVDTLRWQIMDEEVGLLPFGIDKVLGYFIQLLILSRWRYIDEQTGYDRLCKEVLGGEFIA